MKKWHNYISLDCPSWYSPDYPFLPSTFTELLVNTLHFFDFFSLCVMEKFYEMTLPFRSHHREEREGWKKEFLPTHSWFVQNVQEWLLLNETPPRLLYLLSVFYVGSVPPSCPSLCLSHLTSFASTLSSATLLGVKERLSSPIKEGLSPPVPPASVFNCMNKSVVSFRSLLEWKISQYKKTEVSLFYDEAILIRSSSSRTVTTFLRPFKVRGDIIVLPTVKRWGEWYSSDSCTSVLHVVQEFVIYRPVVFLKPVSCRHKGKEFLILIVVMLDLYGLSFVRKLKLLSRMGSTLHSETELHKRYHE